MKKHKMSQIDKKEDKIQPFNSFRKRLLSQQSAIFLYLTHILKYAIFVSSKQDERNMNNGSLLEELSNSALLADCLF
ncbi:hypothetical protein [Terribacillus saccharophilus]|uniref:hypothetical protein n=1 Tax=Terribacillus saccharophilus TaxID=361277 RepID=UPI002DC5D707|nr:hypothetical protein [Terribacillus saccharophilus]